MDYAIKFCLVFFAMFLADICWTYYFISVEERKSLKASLWGVGIYLCGAFTVVSYLEDRSFLAAACLGSFMGVYVSVEYKKRKEKKDIKNSNTLT